MSDLYALAVLAIVTLFAIQIACTVALARMFWRSAKHLYRRLTKQSHGARTNCDTAVFGAWPSVPNDLKVSVFHSRETTRGE